MRNISLFFVVFLVSCSPRVTVHYDLPLDEALAKAAGRELVVVLSRPDCPPCLKAVQAIGNGMNIPAATYNIVDVQVAENQWFPKWLCMSTFPTFCVFNKDGRLAALISGANDGAMDCLGRAINGDTKCADYQYTRNYALSGDNIEMLNEVLDCQRGIARGEDMAAALDAVLKKTDYPWPMWLQVLNEQKQGRSGAEAAARLAQFTDPRYLMCYPDILQQAKYIANPLYSPEDEAVLELPAEEIILTDCTVGEPREFEIPIKNIGRMPLTINDITLSCTCLELLSDKQLTLAPGASAVTRVAFTAETEGESYREVMFFSNSTEKLMRVPIRATTKK